MLIPPLARPREFPNGLRESLDTAYSLVRGGAAVVATLLGTTLSVAAPTAAPALPVTPGTPVAVAPRSPLPKPLNLTVPRYAHRLAVKFRDDLRVRADLTGGRTRSLAGADLSDIERLARRHQAHFSQLLQLPPERLEFLRQRARNHSGNAQPDLGGMLLVTAPASEMQQLAAELNASDLTEWVHFQQFAPAPPCEDIAPATPPYFPALQGYWGADPGLNLEAAWTQHPAARGGGIQLADCEYWYVDGHEDLCDISNEPGQTPDPAIFSYGWQHHGGATLGELASLDNAYGCTGLVPDAQILFFTEWSVEEGYRRVTAIANAIASVEAGDVVQLEMQAIGGGGGYCPAEYDPAVWTLCRNATDSGIVVVGAGGNGNQDLDSGAFTSYMERGDSGAILVGAGSADTAHNKLYFSTYGSRINLQGWGGSVFTLGYGDYALHGGDSNQSYTAGFSGTSSATPLVAACAVSLQGMAEHYLGRRLEPNELRSLLIDTGTPQGSGGHIGPLPDMAAATNALLELAPGMVLGVRNLVAGAEATFSVTRAEPGATVYFIYSRSGAGSTYVPALDVTLALDAPILAGSAVADDSGEARFAQFVPPAAAGMQLWIQAAANAMTSDMRAEVVQ